MYTVSENMIMHRRKDCCCFFLAEKTASIAASQYRLLWKVDKDNVNSLTLTLNFIPPSIKINLEKYFKDSKDPPEEVQRQELNSLDKMCKQNKEHRNSLTSVISYPIHLF